MGIFQPLWNWDDEFIPEITRVDLSSTPCVHYRSWGCAHAVYGHRTCALDFKKKMDFDLSFEFRIFQQLSHKRFTTHPKNTALPSVDFLSPSLRPRPPKQSRDTLTNEPKMPMRDDFDQYFFPCRESGKPNC